MQYAGNRERIFLSGFEHRGTPLGFVGGRVERYSPETRTRRTETTAQGHIMRPNLRCSKPAHRIPFAIVASRSPSPDPSHCPLPRDERSSLPIL